MKTHELENWVLSVLRQVESKQPLEDSRVELKREWIPPEKAARLIAAHANASQGEAILWVIGIDEKDARVIGTTNRELADWYRTVTAQFDDLAPCLLMNLNVPWNGTTVVALLFETDRAPFVVKNPKFGREKGEGAALEVPWREGTSTRSAFRSDLLRLLSPIAKLPTIEVCTGALQCLWDPNRPESDGHVWWYWYLDMRLYVVPTTEARLVIPFHRCQATFELPGQGSPILFDRISLDHPDAYAAPVGRSQSHTITGTSTEVLITGPGMMVMRGEARQRPLTEDVAGTVQIFVRLYPIDALRPIVLEGSFSHFEPSKPESSKFTFSASSSDIDTFQT